MILSNVRTNSNWTYMNWSASSANGSPDNIAMYTYKGRLNQSIPPKIHMEDTVKH